MADIKTHIRIGHNEAASKCLVKPLKTHIRRGHNDSHSDVMYILVLMP
jgi:hypothetical protein